MPKLGISPEGNTLNWTTFWEPFESSIHSEYILRFRLAYKIIFSTSDTGNRFDLFDCSIFEAYSEWAFSVLFRDGQTKKQPSLKIFTYILQLWKLAPFYLTQRWSKKYVNHVTHFLSFVAISIFLPEISSFCYIKKYRYRLYLNS